MLGTAIKQTRLHLGLSLSDVAARGVRASALSLIENGKRQPSLGMLNKIAAALGVPPCLLLFMADYVEFPAGAVKLALHQMWIGLGMAASGGGVEGAELVQYYNPERRHLSSA